MDDDLVRWNHYQGLTFAFSEGERSGISGTKLLEKPAQDQQFSRRLGLGFSKIRETFL